MTRRRHPLCAALLALALAPASAQGGSVVATRDLAVGTIAGVQDLRFDAAADGPWSSARPFLGLEVRAHVFAGQALDPAAFGPPTAVTRNTMVRIEVVSGGVRILSDGRALTDAAVGEAVDVMSTATRRVVTGVVVAPGQVRIGGRR